LNHARYFNIMATGRLHAAAVPIFFRQRSQGEPVQVCGDGSQTRDLIHVHDVVNANLVAADHPSAPGEVFNICTGIETRLLDLLISCDLFPIQTTALTDRDQAFTIRWRCQ
jgi:UDP-glucose 4-epimerase